MKALLRTFTLLRVMVRHRLDIPLLQLPIPLAMRLLIWMMPWRFLVTPTGTDPIRVKHALVDLGPIFVKFGQLLATRRDLLDDDWADALGTLLDKVPPFPGEQAQAIVEQAVGKPVTQVFKEFDIQPLASASVAQVHGARLNSGEAVIVKVIRPGVKSIMQRDIRLTRVVASLMETWLKDARRLRAHEVIDQFEQSLFDELDMQREGANASQIKRNFDGSELIYIPKIYWQYTNTKVLVQERIYGLPVTDIEAIKAAGINCKELARVGVEIFFTQVFRDSFFHADMHAGNIFVNPAHPDKPQYMAVDFGIVGSLTHEDQSYLARMLLAFFEQDYQAIAQLHLDSGWLPEGTPLHEFEGVIRTVSEPIFAKPLADISFAQMLIGLFQTARRFNMTVQPQLVLLEKTLLNIEGLGRQLYPELDLWQTAQPVLRRWYKDQVSPKQVMRQLRRNWPDMAQQLPQLPSLVHAALTQQARPVIKVERKHPQRKPLKNWLAWGLLVSAFITFPIPQAGLLTSWQGAQMHIIAIVVAVLWLVKRNNEDA